MSIIGAAKSGMNYVNTQKGYLDNTVTKSFQKMNLLKIDSEGLTNGITNFVFDYFDVSNLNLQAEITDHYTEDNTSIQDHVALKPIKYKLKGFIGEQVKYAPKGIQGGLEALQNKLGIIPAYLGDYTPGALQDIQSAISQAQNVMNTVDEVTARAESLIGIFDSTPTDTKQQKAYKTLYSIWKAKQVCTLQTPYSILENMVIESIQFLQDADTKYVSDIEITLKQINFASTKTESIDSSQFATKAQQQNTPVTDLGKSKGNKISVLAQTYDNGMNSLSNILKGEIQ